ncbi:unnamed protein product [Camellia sinensis]
MSGQEEKGEILNLESFFHPQHPLTLLDDELTDGERCNECGLQISGPAFTCTPCKFFIHKSCSELPSQIHHPLHPDHPLTLSNPPSPPSFNGIFVCELCLNIRDGFSFYCAECHFALDSRCALHIPFTIQHAAHEHPLSLVFSKFYKTCVSCNTKTGIFYECTVPGCSLSSIAPTTLDFDCALLPAKMKHIYHRHPLQLTLLHSEDDSDEEYYCDACENLRNPNGLFYCCAECEFVAHTSCDGTLPLQLIPPTKSSLATFKDGIHDHALTLVPLSLTDCHDCSSSDYYVPHFRCEDCNYDVDARCASKTPKTRRLIQEEKAKR